MVCYKANRMEWTINTVRPPTTISRSSSVTERHAMLEQLTQYGVSKQFSYATLIYQSIYLERSKVDCLNDVITSNTLCPPIPTVEYYTPISLLRSSFKAFHNLR